MQQKVGDKIQSLFKSAQATMISGVRTSNTVITISDVTVTLEEVAAILWFRGDKLIRILTPPEITISSINSVGEMAVAGLESGIHFDAADIFFILLHRPVAGAPQAVTGTPITLDGVTPKTFDFDLREFNGNYGNAFLLLVDTTGTPTDEDILITYQPLVDNLVAPNTNALVVTGVDAPLQLDAAYNFSTDTDVYWLDLTMAIGNNADPEITQPIFGGRITLTPAGAITDDISGWLLLM